MKQKNSPKPESADLAPVKKDPEMSRTAFWLDKALLTRCDLSLPLANCRSRNEFVNNAIRFYIAYLNANYDTDFLCHAIHNMMSGILAGSKNRIRRIQFKEAVELAKLSHILAAQSEIDDETLCRLHVRCVEEVKRTNGVIPFDAAMEYQHGNE